MSSSTDSSWDIHIRPRRGLLRFNINELWNYRDLIFLFVRREFVAHTKQTVLGPIWYVVQPVLSTLTFTVVFGNIAGISTDGQPQILFYMCGLVTWGYFSMCLSKTSHTFIHNINIFSKVYFPRLVVPISTVMSGLISFSIQFLVFLGFWAYFYFFTDSNVQPNKWMLALPYLVLLMGLMGMGFGIIISAITTKYRDLTFLIGFGVQLWMYCSPVIYSVNTLRENMAGLPWIETIILANPMTAVIETMRYGWLGSGNLDMGQLAYATTATFVVLFVGLIFFNRVDKTFTDTV